MAAMDTTATIRLANEMLAIDPRVRLSGIGVTENGMGETVVDHCEVQWEGPLSEFLKENTLELHEFESLISHRYCYMGGGAMAFSKLEIVEEWVEEWR